MGVLWSGLFFIGRDRDINENLTTLVLHFIILNEVIFYYIMDKILYKGIYGLN